MRVSMSGRFFWLSAMRLLVCAGLLVVLAAAAGCKQVNPGDLRESAELHAQAMQLFLADRAEDALPLLDASIELDPRNYTFHKDKAVVLGYLKRYEEAYDTLEAARPYADALEEGYMLQGMFMAKAGKEMEAKPCYEQALKAYDAALAKGGASEKMRLDRILALYLLDGKEAALQALDEFTGKYPDHDAEAVRAVRAHIDSPQPTEAPTTLSVPSKDTDAQEDKGEDER